MISDRYLYSCVNTYRALKRQLITGTGGPYVQLISACMVVCGLVLKFSFIIGLYTMLILPTSQIWSHFEAVYTGVSEKSTELQLSEYSSAKTVQSKASS